MGRSQGSSICRALVFSVDCQQFIFPEQRRLPFPTSALAFIACRLLLAVLGLHCGARALL